jgi:restriction system protein
MARRSKGSLTVALLHTSAKMPLWTNLLVAGACFVGLRQYAGAEPPQFTATGMRLGEAFIEYLPKIIAFYGQYVLPLIFILGGLIGSLLRKSRSTKFSKISSSDDPGAAIRSLTWHEFEQMVGEALRRQSYTVTETKKGPDGGVDLILRKDGELFFVQCKQWRAYKVSVQVVRELYGVMAAQGAAGGFVVTTGVFTAEAHKFAKGTSIQLIDGQTLTRWFRA